MKKGDIRLQEIYNYIETFTDDNSYPPSVREIAERFNIKSTSTVHYYLEKLRNDGLIKQDGKKKRSVSLNKVRAKSNYIPLVGTISAGQGILATENIEGEYPLPQDFFSSGDLYMLRVEGDSMINVGINNGDYVIVHKQDSADLGEIVVALWQNTATVKRLKATYPHLVLHPENYDMDDIIIRADENPTIIGKVVGCIKKF